MMLTRGEKRALVFLSASFLCGLLLLGLRSLGREKVSVSLEGKGEDAAVAEMGESPVNINSAGLGELITLPGIGEKYARRIIELRRRQGRFESVDELLQVEGIGPKRLEKIRPMICLGKEGSGGVNGEE